MSSTWKTIVTSLAGHWKENCPDNFPELSQLHGCIFTEASDEKLESCSTWDSLVGYLKVHYPCVEFSKGKCGENDDLVLGLLFLIRYGKMVSPNNIEGLSTLSRNNRATLINFLQRLRHIPDEDINEEIIVSELCKRSHSPRKRRRRGKKGDKSVHSEQRNENISQDKLFQDTLSGDDTAYDGASENNDEMELSQVSELEASFKEREINYQQEINEMQTKMSILQDMIVNLQEEKESFMSTLQENDKELEKLRETEMLANSLKLNSEEARSLLQEKESFLDQTKSELSTVRSQLAKELDLNKELKKDVNSKSLHIGNLETRVSNLIEEKKTLSGKYHDQLQECAMAKQKLEDAVSENTDLKRRLEKFLQDKEELFKTLSDKEKEMGALNTRLESVTNAKGLLEVDVILKEKYVHRTESQAKDLQTQNDSLQLELKNLKNDFQVQNHDLVECQGKLNTLESLNKNNIELVEKLEKELQVLDQKWQNSVVDLNNLKDIEATSRSEIETLRSYNNQLIESNELNTAQINEKNLVISRLTDRCNELSNDVTVLKSNFEMKTREILVLDQAFIAKKGEMDEMRALVKSLEDEVTRKNTEVFLMKSEAEMNAEKLASLKEKYEASIKDLTKLKGDKSENESQQHSSKSVQRIEAVPETDNNLKDSFVMRCESQNVSFNYMASTEKSLTSFEGNEELQKMDDSVRAQLESRVNELEGNNHKINLINSQLKDEIDKLTIEKSELTDLVGKLRLELEAKSKLKKKMKKATEEPQTSQMAQEYNDESSSKKSRKFTLSFPLFGGLFSSQKSKSNLSQKENLKSNSSLSAGQKGDSLSQNNGENSQMGADPRELDGLSTVLLDAKAVQSSEPTGEPENISLLAEGAEESKEPTTMSPHTPVSPPVGIDKVAEDT